MADRSEVAQLMRQIEDESQAMQRALTGFAMVAKHETIAHRYDAIGRYRDQLAALVGEQQATEIMVESYSRALAAPGEACQ